LYIEATILSAFQYIFSGHFSFHSYSLTAKVVSKLNIKMDDKYSKIREKLIKDYIFVSDGLLLKKLKDLSVGTFIFNYVNDYSVVFQKNWKFMIKQGRSCVMRFDGPHKGCETNHININPKYFGGKDPHIPLPAGSLFVSI
jgi:hypothetical protein